jgi:hypothetical protein
VLIEGGHRICEEQDLTNKKQAADLSREQVKNIALNQESEELRKREREAEAKESQLRTRVLELELSRRPELIFTKWGNIGQVSDQRDTLQCGFFMENQGDGAARAVLVQGFTIEEGSTAASAIVSTIGKGKTEFARVWLEGYSPFGFDPDKWNLLAAMKKASDDRVRSMYRANYVVRIAATYKDVYEHSWESSAELSYIPARNELVFGPTTQCRLDNSTMPL